MLEKIIKYIKVMIVALLLMTSCVPETDIDIDHETPIEEVCPQRITLEIDGETVKIPYCRNYPLGKANDAVERAIVVIHGTNRTADDYYDYILNSAEETKGMAKTIIIAPQFLIDDDIDEDDFRTTATHRQPSPNYRSPPTSRRRTR